MAQDAAHHARTYWRKSLVAMAGILLIWAFISFGCGILFRNWLDARLSIGGAPFGFWMAQQGSIIGFVVLLIAYAIGMHKLDVKHNYDEGDQTAEDHSHDSGVYEADDQDEEVQA